MIKFLPTPADDNTYFEVSLAAWIVGTLSKDLEGMTRWPPASKSATSLVKARATPDESWDIVAVKVLKYFGKFCQEYGVNILWGLGILNVIVWFPCFQTHG